MHIAHFMLSREIHWLASSSDPLLAPLEYLPGWSIVHPLTRGLTSIDEHARDLRRILELPTGDGRVTVSTPFLHCVVPDEVGDHTGEPLKQLKGLLTRLRHVSRQATLPRGESIASFHCSELDELPKVKFPEPYFGKVGYGDSSFLPTTLTMELAIKAGQLPPDFEPPVQEGILLDAMKAMKEYDFRAAMLYTAIAVEVLVGTVLDEEHDKLLRSTPPPAQIRVVESQEGRTKGSLEDPVYDCIRNRAKFTEYLHELPLYVLKRSLKLERPELFSQAHKLYQTRNSLAHRGEPCGGKDQFPVDAYGVIDALKCAIEIFAWFGVPGEWSIPFEQGIEQYRRKHPDAPCEW
jgi:hypothetical protein